MADSTPIDVVAIDRVPEDEFYLVSGDDICAWRGGKAVRLEGAELERVRRWIIRELDELEGGRG